MRRSLLVLAAAAAAFVATPATADPVDPPCDFTFYVPDVQIDPDGPYFVTITPEYPHYTC